MSSDGTYTDDSSSIKEEKLRHFEKMINESDVNMDFNGIKEIIEPWISREQANKMVTEVMNKEIKITMFDMANGKAPKLNKYGAYIYKQSLGDCGR